MDCLFDCDTLECSRCGRRLASADARRNCGASDDFACKRGPGTELKKLLAGWPFYITASPDCSCNDRAAEMDRREQETPGWCEANLDTIVGWLREQSEARGLPFLDLAGRLLVRRAIRNARRNA
jgi:hypothetical protein